MRDQRTRGRASKLMLAFMTCLTLIFIAGVACTDSSGGGQELASDTHGREGTGGGGVTHETEASHGSEQASEAEPEKQHHGQYTEGIAIGHVVFTEWSITGEGGELLKTLPTGEAVIEVHNDGEMIHQLAIWLGGKVVGDHVQGGTLVAETGHIKPGGVASLTVNLEPGNYIVVCPIPGHLTRGMHIDVPIKASS